MIELKNLTLQRGSKVLLDKAALTINPGARVGLIGKNGTGKSSLFALIKGEISHDAGDVLVPKHWRLASVAVNAHVKLHQEISVWPLKSAPP